MRKQKVFTLTGILILFGSLSASENLQNSIQISDEERQMLMDIAMAVRRVKRNPFLKDQPVRESTNSDLREKEENDRTADDVDDNETSSSSRKSSSRSDLFKGKASDYCDNFEQHFSFYCVGEIDQSQQNEYVIEKFCPSYKKACAHKTITSSVSLTSWPANPFDKKIAVSSSRPLIDEEDRRGRGGNKKSRKYFDSSSDDDSDSQDDAEIYYSELKKRYPCKPDCDKRLFPHCTQECKCDYIYPVVQRFCNPPPLPLFLNTCRLWYHGCPKYERYHYASQFVYSKAEKGKVLPGSPQRSQINPYNIPAPVPLRNRAVALAPIRAKRSLENDRNDDVELIVPPPVPEKHLKKVSGIEKAENREIALNAPQSRAILKSFAANLNEEKGKKKKKRSGKNRSRLQQRKQRKRRSRRRRRRYHSNHEEILSKPTTPRPPTPKELYSALKRINSITSGPGAIGIKSSPATLKGGNREEQGGLDGFLNYVSEQNQQTNQIAKEWTNVAQDSRKFTKDLLNAVEATTISNSDVDFEKVRPRTLSSGPSTTVESGEKTKKDGKAKAFQGQIPILPSDASYGARSGGEDTFRAFDGLSDSRGLVHTPRSRSPFTKPGLWEPNPDDPHSRDAANKYWYHPESVGVDWLNGQLQWGGHWAVPAAGAGGTAGMSAVHFPTIGSFLNIPDDYD